MNRQALFMGTHSVHGKFLLEADAYDFKDVQIETIHHYFSGFGQSELSGVYYENTSFNQIWYSPREINLSKFTFGVGGNEYFLITHSSLADSDLIRQELDRDLVAERATLMEYASTFDYKSKTDVFCNPINFHHMFDKANDRTIEAVFVSEKEALVYLYAHFSLGSFKEVVSDETFLAYCEESINDMFERIEDEENGFDDFDDAWDEKWRNQWLRDFNEVLPLDQNEEDEY